MLIETPPKFRKRRAKVKRTETGATPSAPTLLSASVAIEDSLVLTLAFDVAVSIAGFNASEVSVEYHPLEGLYGPTSVSMVDPQIVRVEMSVVGDCPIGPDVILNAGAGNGIVADDGGEAWAGVTDLELPFP